MTAHASMRDSCVSVFLKPSLLCNASTSNKHINSRWGDFNDVHYRYAILTTSLFCFSDFSQIKTWRRHEQQVRGRTGINRTVTCSRVRFSLLRCWTMTTIAFRIVKLQSNSHRNYWIWVSRSGNIPTVIKSKFPSSLSLLV